MATSEATLFGPRGFPAPHRRSSPSSPVPRLSPERAGAQEITIEPLQSKATARIDWVNSTWLFWRGIVWLVGVVSANWLLTLWIVLAVVAVALFLWARSRINDSEGWAGSAENSRNWARSKFRQAAD